jgi:2-hydroxychromene-2-carboxylate isomerase
MLTAALTQVTNDLGLDFDRIFARSADPSIKDRLREQTAAAQQRGLFGAPTFVTPDGELFWGDDRLEMAIAWARRS